MRDQFFDDLTWKRICNLASDMGLTTKEVVRRAVEVLATARTVAKGHEVSRRNKDEHRKMGD